MIQKLFKNVFLFLLVCLIVTGATFYYFFMPSGVSQETVNLVIARGNNIRSVTDTLEQMGVVRSSRAMNIWLKLTGKDKKMQAGRFVFQKGEGALSASRKLLNAQSVDKVVTVLEGLTVEQTAAVLYSELEIDTTEFINLCYDTSFVRKMGIEAESLEGYLFPDTYRFPEQNTARTVIARMVSRFMEVYSGIEGDSAVMAQYSTHELITIASIVEKEATLPSERGRIAGVFHNRLKIGYPLGADPTVRYIFRKFDGPLRVSELNVDNPYNTRRFKGIPPGPICSPGRAAIKATLSPDSTDELYFVAKWDGTGAHDFSKTYREHNRKKLKYRRLNEMRKQRIKRGESDK